MKNILQTLKAQLGLAESITMTVFGVAMLILGIVIQPTTLPAIVLGGMLAFCGVCGLLINKLVK